MISRFEAFVTTLHLVKLPLAHETREKTRKISVEDRRHIFSVTFVVDFLSCTSCVSWAKRV
jgi:hypothetical protein